MGVPFHLTKFIIIHNIKVATARKPFGMKNQHNYLTGCFRGVGIANGDLLCVGGTFPGIRDLFLLADFKTFEPFFSKVQSYHNKISSNAIQCGEWLQSCGSDTDPEIFLALHAFQSTLKTEHPEISKHANTRNGFYAEDTPAHLGDVVAANAAQCAEIALLAHESLNRIGIENEYVSGAVAWRNDNECPGEHCYIRIPLQDRIIIYDPSNPVMSDQGQFPAIYEADRKQDEKFEEYAAKGPAFMILRNTLTRKDAFYGVHGGTGIDLRYFTIGANGSTIHSGQTEISHTAPEPHR